MELGQGSRLQPEAERGYAMAALLIGLSVMAVLASAAVPVWSQFVQREKEEELIWRGQQYARAIGLFQRKYANTFPPNVTVLVEQKFLRKKYVDPITNDEFQVIPAGGAMMPGQAGPGGNRTASAPALGATPVGAPQFTSPGSRPGGTGIGTGQPPAQGAGFQPAIGIQGVVSKSKDPSIKIYNGRSRYDEWMFVYLAAAQRLGAGAAGSPTPGAMPPGSGFPGSTTFTPLGGADRRPGVGGAGQPGRGGQGGQQPFGPSPFGPTQPTSPFGRPAPPRPPGQ